MNEDIIEYLGGDMILGSKDNISLSYIIGAKERGIDRIVINGLIIYLNK